MISESAITPGVMHVVWSLGIAGAEKLAYDMAVHLPANGFRPVVCCIEHDGPLRERLETAGIPVYFRKPQSGLDWSLVFWLRKLIASEHISVVHAHQYNPFFYSALALVGVRGVNLVYTEHGRIYPEVKNWKRMLINPFLALRVNHIVSISERTVDAMVKYDRLPAGRIRVIHNGVDLDKYNNEVDVKLKRQELEIPDGWRVVGTAARLEPVKNLPMMLRAFQKVVDQLPETVLLIAGEGSEGMRLKALADELGIALQVKFLGLRSDLPEIFAVLEVFLLTSYTEGISITILEAMASGIPAVVTDVGGNPEVVIDGLTGMLVRSNDDNDLAVKILALLTSPESGHQMGSKALARANSQFSFQKMMDNYVGLYEKQL